MTDVWSEEFARRTGDPEPVLSVEEPDVEYLGLEPEALDEPLEEPDLSADVLTLLNNGKLVQEETLRGERVRLRTLKIGEELEIGLLIQRYEGSPEEGRAYITAVVASACESVNGKPLVALPAPVEPEEVQRRKWEYVRRNWYRDFIEEVYDQVWIPLQARYAAAQEELRSKSQASQLN